MNETPNIPEAEPEISTNHHAVSLYSREIPDDFPVLKAFQQYIDAEQEKARKRMLTMSIFFGCLLTVVITFFLVMLSSASARNQALNDRLIDYAIKDRERQASVVVQQPQDNSAILSLTARLDEMQKQLMAAQQQAVQAEQARTEAARQAAEQAEKDREAIALALEKKKTQEALEVERLKALLAAEREKAAAEREKKREAELEEYRRKHYPEFYRSRETAKAVSPTDDNIPEDDAQAPDPIEELLEELSDDDAITYFTEEEDDKTTAGAKGFAIPIEIKGSRNKWRIPNE